MHTNSAAVPSGSAANPNNSSSYMMDHKQMQLENDLVKSEMDEEVEANANVNGRHGQLSARNIRKSNDDEELEEDEDDEEDDDEEEEEEEEEEESGSPMGYDEAGVDLDCNGDGADQPPGLVKQMNNHHKQPYNNTDDDDMEEGEEEKVLVPAREIATIKTNLQFLNHQMSLLIRALNVKPCACTDCDIALKIQQKAQNQLVGTSSSQHNHLQKNGISKENGFKVKVEPEGYQSRPLNVSSLGIAGEATQRGRRSKYCTPAEKKAVAGYVQIHGATAAARKFNIPPAVASYYHRREFKHKPSTGRFTLGPATPQLKRAMKGGGGTDSSGEGGGERMATAADGNEDNKEGIFNQLWQSNSTGGGIGAQHAYLRGRGRGRPKLIGDELDAELVEHIVKLKQQTPNAHLAASQALIIARNYIAQKAPGLLEEHGGQVKLKVTWAMKLVTRVMEREREIQLGLPPGTLQNLPRLGQTDELLGQNFNSIDVNALLAAATNSTNDGQGGDAGNTDNAAMLNAMLEMATTGGSTADMFNMADQHQQPSTSRGNHPMSTKMETTTTEEQESAIRQLLASLQGGGQMEHPEATELDVAAALAQMSG